LRDAEAWQDLELIYVQLRSVNMPDLSNGLGWLRQSVMDGLNGLPLDAEDPDVR